MKWLPLPKIAHGIAIYPFTPSTLLPIRPYSTSNVSTTNSVIDDASTVTSSSSNITDQPASANIEDYSHLIPLEVGDELFIIEQQGQWYRGYVLCAYEEGKKPNNAPIGCFPRSHVQIKEYIDIGSDEADILPFKPHADEQPSSRPPTMIEIPNGLPRSFSESYIQSTKQSLNIITDNVTPPRPGSFSDLNLEYQAPDFKKPNHARIPPPPLPLARFDQSTITGSSEPLVDEIAACVSEWNSLLYTYIKQRDYNAFHIVKDNINYLFQARRQLLDQALSREELSKLRKGIVYRMVISNLEQNQDMIIRHPEKGYLLDAANTSLSTIYKMHWKFAVTTTTSTTAKSMPPLLPKSSSSSSLKQDNAMINASAVTLSTINSVTSSATTTTTNSTAATTPTTTLPEKHSQKGAKFYHLYFEFKACVAHICQPGEYTELYFALYSASEKKYLTERFVVILNHQGMPKDESQIGRLQTLFVDLCTHDLLDNVYLVCHIVRLGGMKFTDKEYFGSISSHTPFILHGNKHQSFQKLPNTNSTINMCRRPFGCAVLKLSSLLLQFDPATISSAAPAAQQPSLLDHSMPIFIPTSESGYATLHEDIIFNNAKEFTKNPKAEMIRVSLRTFYGFLDEVLKTNTALLHGIPHTLRLGFADAVFPDDTRNELYVTLTSGDLAQFGRSRNIQVTMCVRDNRTGDIIENAISAGAGARPVTYWESMVFYHELRPTWNETVKINMNDLHQWERSHIYLTVKHRSSHYNGPQTQNQSGASPYSGGGEKIIAMGFLPLFLPPLHRDFIADGVHTLHLYKYDRVSANPRGYLDNVSWLVRSTAPSNMQTDHGIKARSPYGHTRLDHHNSPSNNSFKSMAGSIASNAFASSSSLNEVSSIGSGSTVTQQQTTAGKVSMLRDTITLSTFLCSTQFTQNKTLVKLLNWRSLIEDGVDGNAELMTVLDELTFIGEVEVVKFLGDIFDALFDILVYQHEPTVTEKRVSEINDQVLAAIIWLLGIVQDRRFSNFRPVLDVYIENRFSVQEYRQQSSSLQNYSYLPANETTYDELLKGLQRLCENPGDAAKAKLLRSSMKVWDYLFRFIVRSRLCQQQKEDPDERQVVDKMYKEGVHNLLKSIQSIMDPDQPNTMIGTQTLALQHFADILVELHQIFSSQQINSLAIGFIDACSHVTGRLVGFKLGMILNIVKGPIFNDPSCRLELTKNVFRWIRLWLNSYMTTAKDVIFARQIEQQQSDVDHQQTRLPRAQWIENLRLSVTIMSEVLEKVRRSIGMTSSGIFTVVTSPSSTYPSRPTSFATSHGDEDVISASPESSHHDLVVITDAALELVPQLLNAYKDIQRLTIQALHVSNIPSASHESSPNSRPHSRQSFSVKRERGGSITSKNPGADIQEATNTSSVTSSTLRQATINSADKSKFTVVLQALNSSPTSPFPSTYPLQPKTNGTDQGANIECAALISTGLLDLTVVLLELFYLTPKQQWLNFMKKMIEQEGIEETAEFLRKVIYTCMAILFGDNLMLLEETSLLTDCMTRSEDDGTRETRKIPRDWLNLNIIAHQIVLVHILEPIKDILELPSFIPAEAAYATHDEFEEATDQRSIGEQRSTLLLWRVYFVGFLRVVGSPALEVAQLTPQVQRAVWKIAGNMRGEVGAKTFLSLWELARKQKILEKRMVPQEGEEQQQNRNSKPVIPLTNDYFGGDFTSSVLSGTSFFSNEHGHFSDDPTRRTEEEPHYRHSIRIGPTDEVPLSAIHEEESFDDYIKTDISFLQADLSYHILSPMCSVSLTLHDRVRLNAFSVIADIIAIELYSYGHLIHVQHLLISTLDRLIMSENKGDEQIQSKMAVELDYAVEYRLKADERPDLIPIGKKSVDSLCKFLGLLLQIRSLPADNEFMDERITATLKLMKFIQVIEREEIYIKYVHQLVQLHLDSRNYIEAALTLRFHADLLHWDPTDKLEEVPELFLPAQSSFSRKEALYMKMISYLEQGNAWELCVELCKELAYEYENNIYDYNKLSEILQRQATLVEHVVKKDRCFTEYFRVGFYGRGFPPSSRNQQYIYRGLEWEKMSSFVERMQNRHPNAQLLPSKLSNAATLNEDQLKELETSLDGQYLQITPVVPIPNADSIACLTNPHAPESVKKYYSFNSVSRFSFTHPIIKETAKSDDDKQPESDFLNLWTEKIDFVCEDQFPTIVRRSRIISIHAKEVSPIENAVKTMEDKNVELASLEKKYAAYLNTRRSSSITQPVNINPFSMSLNGAVDAPVNGGVPLYKKAFLSKEYWNKHPEMHPWIERLQAAIYDQVRIIEQCLGTHSKLVSSEMKPFHATLTEFFHKNFAEEIKQLKEKKPQDKPGSKSSSFTSQRRSTYSDHDISPTLSRQNTAASIASLPAIPALSPVSRAFSIKNSVIEGSPGNPTPFHSYAFENASMSRAESLSRTLKMSLRKKSRKKSPSIASVQLTTNTVPNMSSSSNKPQL
ncbi:hypothetical protein BCV72DRAFT_219946 [Rhizopus microsporus var. microsporus]|uniref:Cytoplasmic protein n=2 Tax=Rhizopus microsporus TaxID=58291 RepID=A0A2G4SV80_RHIZD|nr:uncharacterized protein RHIMIDRAFT_284539 [Rhizopus microsporus ATCC 52813]ORE11414.1 hypothetical protein BCV72DRAFT_219946 [Rhizopus microsporus var. microsporus]PHZ12296.1 hypothetical protein RHIMIDRAFT_284539 [Rhizopus microsporus ATCC 52813]